MAGGERLPIVVLGGGGPGRSEMPEGAEDRHALTGYKGVAVRIDGRPLIECVLERLRESGLFAPLYIAGPRRVYAGHASGATVIDVSGPIDATVRAGIEGLRRAHGDAPFAVTSCDILPEVATLGEVLARYRESAPCDGFLPMVRAPEDPAGLGASAYKPTYRVAPQAGAAPVAVLPCHLAVLDPGAFRLPFIYRVLARIYRTRNRSIGYRRRVMLPGVVLELLYQDLRHLLGLRPPNLTWSVLRSGLSAVRALNAGTITRGELEDALRVIFVRTRHRRRHPERRIAMPVVDGLSLALDIDTEEEAAAFGAATR